MSVPYTFGNQTGPISLSELDVNFAYLSTSAPYYPQTAAEVSSGVTPTNYQYPPGNVLRYGADPLGSVDSSAAFQTAVNLCSGQSVFVPLGIYKISTTITMNSTYQSLVGDSEMPTINWYGTGPCIAVTNSGTSLNEWSSIYNFKIFNQVTPTYTTPSKTNNVGIAIYGNTSIAAGVQRCNVQNVRLLSFGCGIYTNSTVNTKLQRVYMENATTFSGSFTSANLQVGIYLDGTPFAVGGISPEASIDMWDISYDGISVPANVQTYGYYLYGTDLRDMFFWDCQATSVNYGWYIQSTSANYDWDVHINRPIVDGFANYGIYFNYFNGQSVATINGGYFAPLNGTATSCVWVGNSAGVSVVGGAQFICNAGVEGIRFFNSSNSSCVGNVFLDATYPISLDAASFCTVTANIIRANTTGFTPTLNNGIRLINAASNNSIIGNTIQGASAGDPYASGISLTSGCLNNMVVGNSIDTNTVVTPLNIADSSTMILGKNNFTLQGVATGSASISLNLMATATGTKTATFSASNKPGTNNQTSPSVWLPVTFDGTVFYIPAFAA